MKMKFLLATLLAFSLAACQTETSHDHGGEHQQATTEVHEHTQEETVKTLALNNGAKWQTDESTRQHAANLEAIANSFQFNENTALDAYHQHAAGMQEELNQLIQDCRMKGPEHDALHLWLEPVLNDTKQLSETQDVAAAHATTQKLHEDTRKFPQYFQ